MEDPYVAEVRKYRLQHTKQFGSDLHLICEDLRQFERSLGDRVVVLLKVSHVCKAVGFAVLPLLLLATVGSVAWYASERRTERDRARRANATAGL